MTKIKICKDCLAEGPVLPSNRREAKYPGPRCYTHHLAKRRADSQREAERKILERFGIAYKTYQAILILQGGGCALCGRAPHRRGRRLAVDHDHTCCPGRTSCGKCVRGLVCWTCHDYLGYIKDSPKTAQNLLDYLRNPPARSIVNSSELV